MKKEFILFLILISLYKFSKSGDITGLDSIPVKHKTNIQKKVKSSSPFQGKKIFCSADSDTEFAVTIKGDNVFKISYPRSDLNLLAGHFSVALDSGAGSWTGYINLSKGVTIQEH